MLSPTYTPPPPGVLVPVPTFFKSLSKASSSALDLQKKYKAKPPARAPLDIEAQTAHTLHLARNGIHGIIFLGSTGEANHLSRAERRELISSQRKALTDAGFKDYPIVGGVLTNSTEDAIEQLRDLKESGAQWGLVLAPGYFAMNVLQDSLRAWWLEVAEESPLPIILYHFPGVSNNVAVSTETYELLAAHPKIVGAKITHSDLSQLVQITQSPHVDPVYFGVYSGLGHLHVPVVTLGGAGVIDGLAAVFPRAIVHLYNLSAVRPLTADALKAALEVQRTVSAAEEMLSKWFIIGIKEAVHKYLGIGEWEGARNPIVGNMGGEGEWAKWNERLDAMRKLEDSLGSKA